MKNFRWKIFEFSTKRKQNLFNNKNKMLVITAHWYRPLQKYKDKNVNYLQSNLKIIIPILLNDEWYADVWKGHGKKEN